MSTLLNERPIKRIATFIACAAGVVSCLAANGTFTVDASRPAGNVSPLFPGLMTEEINHAYDGGLYAELIQNRAFLDDATAPAHWSVVSGSESAAAIALDPANSFNDKLTTSLRLTVTKADKNHAAGVANDGYWGIPVQPNTTYHATILARAGADFSGPLTVVHRERRRTNGLCLRKNFRPQADWKKFEVTLKTGNVTPTAKAHFAITLERPGTVWLGMVSLFPPTWKNQPNGFRKDLCK